LTADAVNFENTTEFSQWYTDLFVDSETTGDQKHALSTGCRLPEKQYMYPHVTQGKTKRYFRRY